MENQTSPLRQYQRQPKLFINLPSNGKWYDEHTVADGSTADLAVFSMTASDEIGFKTPDALINGQATTKTMKSCIPALLNPWNIRTIDTDSILIAIRMATYGQNMSVSTICSKCKEQNAYEVDLQRYLDYYATKIYNDTVIYNDFRVKLFPLTYQQWTDIQKKQTAFQRSLNLQIPRITDEKQKEEAIQSIIDQINELTVVSIFDQVQSIEVNNEIETDKKEIINFLSNQDVEFFHKIKNTIEQNVKEWSLPTEDVECGNCKNKEKLKVSLDSSDFFVQG